MLHLGEEGRRRRGWEEGYKGGRRQERREGIERGEKRRRQTEAAGKSEGMKERGKGRAVLCIPLYKRERSPSL